MILSARLTVQKLTSLQFWMCLCICRRAATHEHDREGASSSAIRLQQQTGAGAAASERLVCPALSYFASKTKFDRSLLINIVLQASSLVEQSVSDSHQDLEEAADAILLEDATARQTRAWRREQLMDPYAGLTHPHG